MKNKIMLVLAGFLLMTSAIDIAQAEKDLGTGTDSLLGGDLTDPEDDGKPEEDKKYNATFTANDEPGFGGGEFAFVIEAIGMRTRDKRYDDMAYEFIKVSITAYSITAILGGLLLFSLIVLYPHLFSYSIISPTLLTGDHHGMRQ